MNMKISLKVRVKKKNGRNCAGNVSIDKKKTEKICKKYYRRKL